MPALWTRYISFVSITWFAVALTLPALLLRVTVPINMFTGSTLSAHVVAGVSCSTKCPLACFVFVCTQYMLDFVTLYDPSTSHIRENYDIKAMFWCMAVLNTVLVLLLFVVVVKKHFCIRVPVPESQIETPTGIPVSNAEIVNEAHGGMEFL